jgi:hypothetical protein
VTNTYELQPAAETLAGNARGEHSADLQTNRNNANQVAEATYSSLLGGSRNRIQLNSNYCVVGGGFTNQILGAGSDYSFLGGGDGNTITVASGGDAVICGGDSNSTTGQWSFIGGGTTHTVSAIGSTICGGYSHTINSAANYSTIGGGWINAIAASIQWGTICGGNANDLTGGTGGSYSTICGGFNNTTSGSSAFIGGGQSNTAGQTSVVCGGVSNTATGTHSFVGCGQLHLATGQRSVICGGYDHEITSSGIESFIGGGDTNYINAQGSVIGGGDSHSITSGTWTGICCGYDNEVDGGGYGGFIGGGVSNYVKNVTAVVCGGSSNNRTGATVSTTNGFVTGGSAVTCGKFSFIGGGRQNQATGLDSAILGGWYAKADKIGQQAHASGRFANDGDAQRSVFVLRESETHSSTTWRTLRTDGVSGDMTMSADTVWTFDCLLVGTTQGCAKSFGFQLNGVIKNDGGTTTMLASNVTTLYDTDDTSFDAQAIADDADDSLKIQVQDTDATGDVVRWVAQVRTIEVNYPA